MAKASFSVEVDPQVIAQQEAEKKKQAILEEARTLVNDEGRATVEKVNEKLNFIMKHMFQLE